MEAETYDLARDFVDRMLSGPTSGNERRNLLTQRLLTHLRTDSNEEVRAFFAELETQPSGATAVEWAAHAMALAGLGETVDAAQALVLSKGLLAEVGADADAARWIAEAEAALR